MISIPLSSIFSLLFLRDRNCLSEKALMDVHENECPS